MIKYSLSKIKQSHKFVYSLNLQQSNTQMMQEEKSIEFKIQIKQGQDDDVVENMMSNIHCREQEQFICASRLQKLLKDENLLLTTQQEQKSQFQKKMHSTLFSYYQSTVHIGESTYQAIQQQRHKIEKNKYKGQDSNDKNQKYSQDRRLFEDEGFGDIYTFVKEVMLSMSKDPYLMMVLIQKYEKISNIDELVSLSKSIVGSMYQNIVDDDVFKKDLLKIIVFCMKKVTAKKNHYEINFLQERFSNLILSEVIERSEIQQYAKQVLRNTLLQIAKLDHPLEFRYSEEQKLSPVSPQKTVLKMHHQDSIKSQDSPIKINRNHSQNIDKKSKISVYSAGLRSYDQKIRKEKVVKRKYKNCASGQLLNYLGINQQINFPCFSTSSSQQNKMNEQINKHLGLMMNRSQQKNEYLYHPDSLILKNIVLIFFNDLFKMLYSMPALIRITCKILYRYLSAKYNMKSCLYVLADFVINFWLISSLQADVLAQAAKLSPFLKKNVEEVMLIIRKIVRDNSKDINEGFVKQFHLLVTNLKVSIANYIHEVVNIDNDKIQNICEEVERNLDSDKKEQKSSISQTLVNSIKSYCVCMSMTDIKKLLELIKGAEKEINMINSKIVNRVKRIYLMSQDSDPFGDKKDKGTGKLYKASKSYALFTHLLLPPNLSVDIAKVYRNAFKDSKIKSVVKKVLLSLPDIESYEEFFTSNTMEDFIFSLEIRDEGDTLYSIDPIPLKLKIQYLQILSRGVKMGKVIRQIQQETVERFEEFKKIWEMSKECYLKTISSLNFQNTKLNIKQKFIRSEIKRKKLEQFLQKSQIKLCLTSPKTREKEIVLKTTLMKNLTQEEHQKIWLENQSNCIHAALNLEFIKSLTGQPEKNRMKYECHISNIMKFPQILCSLPEVKERSNLTEDILGIKDIFFEFIEFIKNFIRSKQNQYAILLENMEWLEQNIELKIGKRLYDKLYPKYPLYDDIALYLRLKTLDWLNFQHLNIEPQLRNWKVWEVAASQLRTIDKHRTAAQKLNCIEQTTKIISNSYKLMSKNDKAVTADDMAPLLILVLIMAAPQRLISSINFIESFASPSKLLSKEGYCLTQIKAALHFCDTATAENVPLFDNEAANYIEFNRKIYQKEIHYGIYFMLGKKKDSPTTEKKRMEYLKQYFKKVQVS